MIGHEMVQLDYGIKKQGSMEPRVRQRILDCCRGLRQMNDLKYQR